MAGKKLSELTTTTTLADSDLVYVVTGTSTKISKGITKANLASEITDALDAQNVKLTGNQTIGGVKTFSVNTVIDGMYIGAKTGAGLQNTVLGNLAGNALTTGATSNTLVGYNSGTSITTGSENTTLGKFAGWGITTGAGNLILGQSTAAGLTTGNNNTIIGSNISGLSTTLTNNIILANGTGAIKAQHDGTNWAFASDLTVTGDVTATNLSGTNTGDSQTLADGVSDVTATATELNILDGLTATTAELNFVGGVTSNVQTQLGTKQNISEKNAVSGYAGLDGSGKINSSQLPSIAITDTFVVASQAAMLALTVEVGDVAVRTDIEKTFILRVDGATVLANWTELQTPTDAVSSVFGRSGVVAAQSNDYTWNQVNKATSSLADVTTRNFSDLQNKPTTVAGYGITDVYTETEADAKYLLNTTDTLTGDLTVTGTATMDGLTVDGNNSYTSNIKFTHGATNYYSDWGYASDGNKVYLKIADGSSSKSVFSANYNGDISFYEDTGTTAKFFWDASAESLGIGTTAPSTALGSTNLTINSADTYASLILQNSGTDRGFFTASNTQAILGTLTTGTTLQFNTAGLGRMLINASGNVGIGTNSPTRTLHVVGGDGGAGTHIAQFEGRSGVVGMYLRGDGNVGIGTTSPGSKLTVNGNIAATTSNYASPSTGGAVVMFQDSNDYATIWAVKDYNGGWADVTLCRLGGNVGIGTASPAYKLDVNGTFRATGAATFSGNLSQIANTAITTIQSTGVSQNAQINITSTVGTWNIGQNVLVASSGALEFNFAGATRLTLSSTGAATFASSVSVGDYKVSALNTAPASATAAGILGEIRYTADYIYVCTATNTWKRTALTTW